MSSETTSLHKRISEELLPFVRHPAHYIGGEVNQLPAAGHWEAAEVRVAFAFPDTYEVGMSHLGSQILYWICNHMPGVCAERVYCPWVDAERIMREKKIPLFTWDNRNPVKTADILAVSLQYEMLFTNLLTILDLAGIPLLSDQRSGDDPIVIAGGPQTNNPEPVAEFIDLIVIGDGEESLPALLEAYRELKSAGASRKEIIAALARRFNWCYAPNLYEPRYNPDGTLSRLEPKISGLPPRISRCRVTDFENAPVPTRPLIPWTEAVHDRISIEIMRGCPQACRFCHEGHTRKPVRFRSVQRILEIAEEAWRATGYSEIGLLSLSTADYPWLRELAESIRQRFEPRMVNISVPSLRIDKMLREVPWLTRHVRKAGLTMAVEAASDLMRKAIRKKVTDENLFEAVKEAYRAGWRSLKLYFIAGLPGESESDIYAMWDLACRVSELRREVAGSPAAVTMSVSWFVPKPFTPMQWAAQPDIEYFRWVYKTLKRAQRTSKLPVRVKTHSMERSFLEAVFARGDRRLCRIVQRAWENGARFDAWDETFNFETWRLAFEREGLDPHWYANRERYPDEVMPWDHIEGPDKGRLRAQYEEIFSVLGKPVPGPSSGRK